MAREKDSTGIGAEVVRVEDARFLTGAGRFTDDFLPEGAARAFVLRSPHANARIRSIDTRDAKAAPGVLAVLTGDDVAADGLGEGKCAMSMTRRDGSPMYQPPRPLLKRRYVRYVGDSVAFVVAETLTQAKDAAELIAVDYEALPAVTTLQQVLAPGAPAIRAACPDNLSFHFESGDSDAVDAAFKGAAHIVARVFPISRVQPNPMEPRAAVAEYDAASDSYTLFAATQSPHRLRDNLAGSILNVPVEKLRVICPDMGGAFGNRNSLYHEYGLALWAARRLGRPVKWTSERSEVFLSDDQGRDNLTRAELALDGEGNFLAMRVRTAAAMGAYLAAGGPGPATNNLGCLAGVYKTPAIHVEVDGYFTNTNPTAAYRGAGRPEAIYVLERLIDAAARELGLDRAEIRRRNMIAPDALPFQTALSFNYDSGDFPENMEKALKLADYAGFRDRSENSAGRGRLRGFGIANAIESAGKPGQSETAVVEFDAGGKATLTAGTCSHGQGHETAYRQLLSSYLGLEFGEISYLQGDTGQVAEGAGTFGSRSITICGGAIKEAAGEIRERALALAADELEAAAADIEFADGRFAIAGTDRGVTIQEIARRAAAGGEPLRANATYLPDDVTFPTACHICEVEIDPDTGVVAMLRYVVVGDFGVLVNPMLVRGQLHGGIAQGAGQTLMEQVLWDPDSGQLLTGSFLDYAMPRAADISPIEIEMNPRPTPRNSLGVKGCGEAGCVGSMAAVMNAVTDALARRGVRDFDMPATPERVWRALAG